MAFTGEMVYPWMFEDFAALRPYAAAADLLAGKEDWCGLYDTKVGVGVGGWSCVACCVLCAVCWVLSARMCCRSTSCIHTLHPYPPPTPPTVPKGPVLQRRPRRRRPLPGGHVRRLRPGAGDGGTREGGGVGGRGEGMKARVDLWVAAGGAAASRGTQQRPTQQPPRPHPTQPASHRTRRPPPPDLRAAPVGHQRVQAQRHPRRRRAHPGPAAEHGARHDTGGLMGVGRGGVGR